VQLYQRRVAGFHFSGTVVGWGSCGRSSWVT
jgi:hypothetical protein